MTINIPSTEFSSSGIEQAKNASPITITLPTYERGAISEHFELMHHLAARSGHQGVLVLAAFGADLGLQPRVQHFAIGDHAGMTAAAMEFENTQYNLYAPPGIYPYGMPDYRKGRETELVALLAAVIDGDADKGKAPPVPPMAADYLLETSQGNTQHFLLFDRALPPGEAKPLCEALQRATGAECAGDISHVWRVPGTLNWPNAAKLARGRSPEPFRTRIINSWPGTFTSTAALRSVLDAHWAMPRSERAATAAGDKHYDLDPAKVEAFLTGLRDRGWFDAGEDARKRYIHATKACAYGLGEEVGRPIWESAVCWEDATEAERDARWLDCSRLRPGVTPITFGSIIEEVARFYNEPKAFLQRDKVIDWSSAVAQITATAPGLPPPPYGIDAPPTAPATEARRSLRDRRVNAASLAGKPPPEREWLVPGWIPMEQVTLLYGDGAVGKSLGAMQLGVSAKTGTPWFGLPVKQGPVEFITAEDSEGELHRRLVDISRETKQPLENMDGLHVSSFADEDAIMAALNGEGQLVKTAFYDEVIEIVQEAKPVLLVLDTLADIYGGNEVVRAQARAFVNMLRKIAIKYQLAVVVLAHPSLAGMRTGNGTSGSTGWSNSVRSRLYLDRVYDEDGSEPDTNARVLRSMKMNYGSVGNEIRMRWQKGVFVVEGGACGPDPLSQSWKAERVFLELLDKTNARNVHVSGHPKANNFAPKMFTRDALKQGVKKGELIDAMGRLIDSKKIENAPYGSPSRMTYQLQRIYKPFVTAPPL
jgi:hypothetical protein